MPGTRFHFATAVSYIFLYNNAKNDYPCTDQYLYVTFLRCGKVLSGKTLLGAKLLQDYPFAHSR